MRTQPARAWSPRYSATVMRSLATALRGRRSRADHSVAVPSGPSAPALDAAAVQVLAHTLIAELFGTGLRVQNLMTRAPDDLRQELDEVASHIDNVIRELRSFAFDHRA